MKLLYVTNSIHGPGGLERVLSLKASYLAEILHYEVHILSLFGDEKNMFYSFSESIQFHNLLVNTSRILYQFSYQLKLKRFLIDLNPDIISVCDDGIKGLLLPLFIGKKWPLIYERHVSKNIIYTKENPSLLKKIVSNILFKIMDYGGRKYDAFVVLTEGSKNEWNIKQIRVIPNPLSFFPEDSDLSSLQNKKVLAVGKQGYQKGYDRLLKAWKLIIDEHQDWKLEIYGTPYPEQGLEKLADRLGINESVKFFKPIKDIHLKYKGSSIYAMSSRYEGFGMVLTEAMSYGVPCISFDCPYGPSDIITDGLNGYLIKNGDIKGFSESLSRLIKSEFLRHKMGVNARNSINKYKIENVCKNWDYLFKEILIKRNCK